MSYISRAQDPGRRTTAIAAVVLVHAALGYALVTGLTYHVIEKVREFRPTFDFRDPPPPPPPEPMEEVLPEPPKAQDYVAPKPPLEMPTNNKVEAKPYDPNDVVEPIPYVLPTPGLIERPRPTPQPSFAPKRAAPRNDASRWVLTDDYPSKALREGAEGVAGFRVVVGSDGRVDACEITRSSGNAQLDEATCKNVTRRARFDPATNGDGQKVVGSYSSTVRWQIPE